MGSQGHFWGPKKPFANSWPIWHLCKRFSFKRFIPESKSAKCQKVPLLRKAFFLNIVIIISISHVRIRYRIVLSQSYFKRFFQPKRPKVKKKLFRFWAFQKNVLAELFFQPFKILKCQKETKSLFPDALYSVAPDESRPHNMFG